MSPVLKRNRETDRPVTSRTPVFRAASTARAHGYGLIELLVTMAVMIVILGLTVETVVQFQRSYRAQSRLIDVQYNARAAMDVIVRLIRNAQQIDPDPDGNTTLDSIHIRGDWNPVDGAFDDPYEDMKLTTSGGLLFKQEVSDAAPVAFSDHIQSLTLTYFDTNGTALVDAVAEASQIAYVRVTLVTTPERDAPSQTLTTAAAMRSKE
jgi:Tfp pilus assembly protein PilW